MLFLIIIILTFQIDLMYNFSIMDINFLPDNPVVLKDIIAELSAKNKADFEHYNNEIADKDLYIHELEEQVRLLKALRFAARSERARPASNEEQYRLFDDKCSIG